jgi:hypothetical protein
VQFGGTNAASFVINSPTQITAVTPAKTASATPVSVSVGAGSLASCITFFFVTGLIGWWKGDAGMTAPSNVISKWADQSGNSNDLTATSTAQPTLVPGGLNGLPYVQFDGVANNLQSSSNALTNTGNFSVFMVMRENSAPAYAWVFNYFGPSYGQWSGFVNVGATNDLMVNRQASNSNISNGASVASPTWHTVSMVQRVAGTESIWSDSIVTNSSVGGDNTVSTNVSLASISTTFAGNTQSDIAEVLFFNANVETSRTAIESYLKAKWGV